MAKMNLLIAEPAGNRTIFVLNKTDRMDYRDIAVKLLANEKYQAEQIGFILDEQSDVYDGKMEMAGLEFCGNSVRSFALYLAKQKGITGTATMRIATTGCAEIQLVEVNTQTNHTRLSMPLPHSAETIECPLFPLLDQKRIIDFGSIVHIVLSDVSADERTFEKIKDFMSDNYDPPALGVMFYDTKFKTFVPAVYVKDIGTTYFESSCASGTVAVALTLATKKEDGAYRFSLMQPGGIIDATVIRTNRQITQVLIESPVKLYAPLSVEL